MIVKLEEDPETGDLILPLPDAVINQMGWDMGDTLLWEVTEDNTIVLSKKENDDEHKR